MHTDAKVLILNTNELWVVTCALKVFCSEVGCSEFLKEYPDCDPEKLAADLESIARKIAKVPIEIIP